MGSTTLMSLEEYLHTTYRPDCDFLEGEIKQRSVGEADHGLIQLLLGEIFRQHRTEWQVRVIPEWRVQVKPQRFRVPDVTVLPVSAPRESRGTVPPLLCIEVLSTDDTLRELQARVNDYIAMGVTQVWVVDPWTRVGYHASASGYVQPEDGILRVPGTEIAVSLPDLFVSMDDA